MPDSAPLWRVGLGKRTMRKGTTVLGIAALAAILAVVAAGISVAAQNAENEDGSRWQKNKMQAIDDSEFGAWKAAMISGLTAERFASLAEKRQSRGMGKLEAREKMDTIRSAIENGNYEAWVAAVSEVGGKAGLAEMVTKEEFYILSEVYNAKKEGNFDRARALMDEHGLNMIPGMGLGMGDGFGMRGEKRGHGYKMGLEMGLCE
jgi:anti-sigma28 factor (negative regulator of flagellin synthesis)